MTTRRSRRESTRRAKAQRRRTLSAEQVSFFNRISPNWIVGGLIGLVVLTALLFFVVLTQFVGQDSNDSLDTSHAQVFDITVNPSDPKIMFLADISGLYRSTNGGLSWDEHLIEEPIRVVYHDPNNPGTFFATGARKLYKSTDGGQTWAATTSNLVDGNISALASDPMDSSVMYAHVGLAGIFRSNDAGTTWARRSEVPNAAITSLAIKPGSPNRVFAFHTIDGLVLSTDGGKSFEPFGTGLPTNAVSDILTLPSAPETMFAAAASNIYKSIDSGRTWKMSNEGLDGVRIIALTQDTTSGNLFAANFLGNVYRSTDQGANWDAHQDT